MKNLMASDGEKMVSKGIAIPKNAVLRTDDGRELAIRKWVPVVVAGDVVKVQVEAFIKVESE